MAKINNGDVFDIGQTINGVSKFLWFNDKWYYFEERMTREYEYDQKELTDLVKNINETEDIKFLGNVLEKQFTEEDIRNVLKTIKILDPVDLEMINSGHGQFPDSFKLTEKGINGIIEQLKKSKV